MITIRNIKSGKVSRVTNNVAHDLIEKGEAELVKKLPEEYNTTSVRPGPIKGYKIK